VAAMTLGGLCAFLPAGVGIDRFGLRPTLLSGVAAAFAGLTLTAVLRDPLLIYPSAALIGFGAATCRVAWAPAIVRLASGALRARALTWNVALLIASGSLWIYLAGRLPGAVERWSLSAALPAGGTQLVLLASAGVTALAALCYSAMPRAPAAGATQRAGAIAIPRDIGVLVLLVGFWMLAAALVLPFFNVYVADRFALPMRDVGAIFAIVKLVSAVVLVGAGELAARFGAGRMLLVWTMLMAPALAWLSVTGTLSIAVALYFAYGIVAPATNPLIDQLLLERVSRERHGVVAGWRNAAAEGAGAAGASTGGRVLEGGSYSSLFLFAAMIALTTAAALNVALLRRRSHAAEPVADAA
jgi:MFS family permease